MNTRKVITALKKKYPGKRIIKNDEHHPTEIICEVEPVSSHPESSLAVAVIDKSNSHYHKKTTETYKVLKGSLNLYIDGHKFILQKGDTQTIKPGQIHWASGNETWVECYSEPGWTIEDHILK